LAQASAMIAIGSYDEARVALGRAEPTADARRQMHRVDYLQGVHPNLSEPLSAQDSEWLLMARAEAGDTAADEFLVSKYADQQKLPNDTTIYLNRVLAHHFAVRRDNERLQAISLALSKAIAEEGKQLATIAEKALDAHYPRIAALALRQIELLNDTPDGLAEIKVRLEELGS
jgi:hypothetical protein